MTFPNFIEPSNAPRTMAVRYKRGQSNTNLYHQMKSKASLGLTIISSHFLQRHISKRIQMKTEWDHREVTDGCEYQSKMPLVRE